jgi:hypothetical protein
MYGRLLPSAVPRIDKNTKQDETIPQRINKNTKQDNATTTTS